jgi:BirA family transcriptional regulator, biotin operon repressor / biotin---[acetyl-CoA-carboxylase] ligase
MLDAGARATLAGTRFGDVRWFDELDSTNREAVDLARAGAPQGVVVVAGHQTAGRGRLGRIWEAPPGSSLLLSVLLRPPLPPEDVHQATMVVGIAASDACEEVAGLRPLLKWPNDVVVDDAKLGGILAETLVAGEGVAAVVVGLGLNVNWPRPLPPELEGTAVALNHVTGHDVDPAELLVRLLQRLDEHYGALIEHGGWRGTLLNYRRLCSTLGREVQVELPHEAFTGRAVDVSGEGHLLVEVAGRGIQRVVAGDVVHLRPVRE